MGEFKSVFRVELVTLDCMTSEVVFRYENRVPTKNPPYYAAYSCESPSRWHPTPRVWKERDSLKIFRLWTDSMDGQTIPSVFP